MLRRRSTTCLKLACIMAGAYLAALPAGPGPVLSADEAPLWGGLKPGDYQVGFRTFELYDRTRTFQPKRDYFGEVVPGERARPIQVLLWYPAAATAEALPVVFSEYAFIPPEDQEFYRFLAGIQDREIGFLYQVFRGSELAVLEALSTEMAAIKDADHAEGRFPLLIYHSDFNIKKRDKLLAEHPLDVELEKILDREAWFVLRALRPGVSARGLAAEYGLEELRPYKNRSRNEIDRMRGRPLTSGNN